MRWKIDFVEYINLEILQTWEDCPIPRKDEMVTVGNVNYRVNRVAYNYKPNWVFVTVFLQKGYFG